MSFAPATVRRVPDHSSRAMNRRIMQGIESRLVYYAARPWAISGRLRQLDEEWNVERMLEANAATLTAAGSLLALAVDRRWAFLPATVGSFLLQHAVQGWCPPLPVLRQMGFRTPHEIDVERQALKHLRGDFTARRPLHGPVNETAVDRADASLEAAQL